MDDLGITWPQISVVLVWIVGMTVLAIQKLKMLVCTHWKGTWTQRIPKWFWLVLSFVLPFALVALACQRWAQDLINPMLPEALRLDLDMDAIVPTALSATLGANGSYAVAKRLGLTGDYTPGGPNDVTPQPVVAPPPVQVEDSLSGKIDELSKSTQGTEQSASRLSDQAPNLSPSDQEDAPNDNSQSGNQNGNVATQTGNVAEYVAQETTNPAYLMRFVQVNTPLVVLSPEGKLYSVYNGQIKDLPNGWQTTSAPDA